MRQTAFLGSEIKRDGWLVSLNFRYIVPKLCALKILAKGSWLLQDNGFLIVSRLNEYAHQFVRPSKLSMVFASSGIGTKIGEVGVLCCRTQDNG